MRTSRAALLGSVVCLSLAACVSTNPTMGDSGAKTAGTGSAAGSATSNANSELERCPKTLGTLAVVEEQDAPWYYELRRNNLQSTVPVIRMLVQQSNCFVVVERGRAMQNMKQERDLDASGEMRAGSNFGKGQIAAADYTLNPTVTFSQKGTGGVGLAVGGVLGGVLGGVAGSMKFNEASTMMLLIDNRSGVQLAAAEGSSRNIDFGFFGGAYPGLFVGAGGYGKTPEGKLVIAAFADAYNQMVRSLRAYKAQEVEGGLGTGGALGVQGGSTPASKPAPKPTGKKKK